MEILEQRILKDGAVKEGGILKVDSFLNHQCDIELFNEMGREFAAHFKGKVTKILTIEASGIGIACVAAQYFRCPVVFAKKPNHSILTAPSIRRQSTPILTIKNIPSPFPANSSRKRTRCC